MSLVNAQVEAGLLEHRDDPSRWAVYADWLEANGSPRGALMSLMLEREAKPSRPLSEAVARLERVFVDLTPPALRTLAARGVKREGPVFRRGVLSMVMALERADFEALVHDPAAALVDRVRLTPHSVEELNQWVGTVTRPLPWRQLELAVRADGEHLDVSGLTRWLPHLERFRLERPGLPESFTFGRLSRLRAVELVSACVPVLSAFRAQPLRRLELLHDPTNPWHPGPPLEPFVSQVAGFEVEQLVAEGRVGAPVESLTERRLPTVVRTLNPDDRQQHWPADEQSVLLFRGGVPAELFEVVKACARSVGAQHVGLQQASLFGASVVRLFGAGETHVVPVTVVRKLAQANRALDVASLCVSVSNGSITTESRGPHVATPGTRGQAVMKRDESASHRDRVSRDVLEHLLGFDPGWGALEQLFTELDFAPLNRLIGDPSLPLTLSTELERQVPPDDDEDEDTDEENEDDEEGEYEDPWEVVDEWGGPPPPVPEVEPRRFIPEPEQPRVLPGGFADDDIEDDEPFTDTLSADEGVVWNEGPVEIPENHLGSTGDPLDVLTEPEPEPLADDVQACSRCQQVTDVARCGSCASEVCLSCVDASQRAAWDEGRAFVCVECVSEGLRVVPQNASTAQCTLPPRGK